MNNRGQEISIIEQSVQWDILKVYGMPLMTLSMLNMSFVNALWMGCCVVCFYPLQEVMKTYYYYKWLLKARGQTLHYRLFLD